MHMADALLSPAVGGSMWAVSGCTIAYCSRKLKRSSEDSLVPLMGVLGAFVFAAQMINFTIPCTGSSGHLGGGMLLAMLLGPHAAFIVISSVLVVQALFFADGGLLALGCNIFNLGFFPAFVAYPLIFRPLVGDNPTKARLFAGSVLGAVTSLELGALSVVIETLASGITDLPPRTFLAFMLPIHLAIGLVEGVVTALVAGFVWEADPRILALGRTRAAPGRIRMSVKAVALTLLLAAAVTGSVVSWYASAKPDGLEWSMARVSGREEPEGSSAVHRALASMQERLSFLPDYSFRGTAEAAQDESASRIGTSVSGLLGGAMVLALALGVGLCLRRHGKRPEG